MSNKNQEIIELVLDGKDEYSSVSEEVRDEIKKLVSESDKLSKKFKELEKSLDLSDVYNEQEKELSDLIKKQSEAQISVTKLTKANRESKGENKELVSSLVRAKAELASYRASTNKMQKSMDLTKRSAKSLGLSVKDLTKNQKASKEEYNKLGGALTKINQKQTELVRTARKQAEAVKEVTRRTKESAKETAELTAKKTLEKAVSKALEKSTKSYSLELRKLVEQYKKGSISSSQFARAEKDLRNRFKLSESQVRSARLQMGAYADELRSARSAQEKAGKNTDKLTRVTRRLAQAYTVLLAAKKTSDAALYAVKSYTDTEDAMLGLAKTTSLTSVEIQSLADELEGLSNNVTPKTKKELLGIAEAAGRMGVDGADNIKKFVKSLSALDSASDLVGDEAATAIARILKVTGEADEAVNGVASAIVALGNNTAASESEIANFALRLASTTVDAKLTSSEVLGLSAGMKEMGIQAEGASTVIGRMFRVMADAVAKGGKDMDTLSRVTGKTSEEIEEAFGSDKVALFGDFVKGIKRLQDEGGTLNSVLEEMGIKNDENARILGTMAERYERVGSIIELSNEAFEDGNAHFREAAKQAAGLSSGLGRLKNQMTSLAEKTGEAFSDDLYTGMQKTAEQTKSLEEKFGSMGEVAADVAQTIIELLGTVSTLSDALGEMVGSSGLMEAAMDGVSTAVEFITIGINSLIVVFSKLAIVQNDFFGDTDDVKRWQKIHDEALGSASSALDRIQHTSERMSEGVSRAFQDLRRAYGENKDAVSELDKETREAIKTILASGEGAKGHDKLIRRLTRSIQRQGEETRILDELTKEENDSGKLRIELLEIEGMSRAKAIEKVREEILARKDYGESGEENLIIEASLSRSIEELAHKRAGLTHVMELSSKEYANLVDSAGSLTEAERKAAKEITVLESSIVSKQEKLRTLRLGTVEYREATQELMELEVKLAELRKKQNGEIDATISSLSKARDAYKSQTTIIEDINEKISSGLEITKRDIEAKNKALEVQSKIIAIYGDQAKEALNNTVVTVENTAATNDNTEAKNKASQVGTSGVKAQTAATEADTKAKKENTKASIEAASAAKVVVRLGGKTVKQWEDAGEKMSAVYAMIKKDQSDAMASFMAVSRAPEDYVRQFAVTMNNAMQAGREAFAVYERQNQGAEKLLETLEKSEGVTQGTLERADRLLDTFDMLDQQTLDSLRSAIDDAQTKVDDLNGSVKDTLESLRDELDRLNGDQEAIETRSYERKREELRAQLELAGKLDSASAVVDAREALTLLEQTYRLKTQELAKQERLAVERESPETITKRSVEINLNGRELAVNVSDARSEQALLDLLEEVRNSSEG